MKAYRKSSQYMFGAVPVIHHKRSIHNLSHKNLLTTSMGRLTPILLEEVYPGDDFKITPRMVVRTSTPFIRPIMDNIFADVHFFFVPSRLLFDDWEEVFGSAKPSQWTSPSYATVPTISASPVSIGSIADYFGLPVGSSLPSGLISDLPFRAYAKIYNDWYRDENLQDEVLIQTDDTSAMLNDSDFSASNFHGMCANVCKLHDYFTQALPAPQKGNPVSFPSVQVPSVTAPVYAGQAVNPRPEAGWYTQNFYVNSIGPQTNTNSPTVMSPVPFDGQYFYNFGIMDKTVGGDSSSSFNLYADAVGYQSKPSSSLAVTPNNLYAAFPATSVGLFDVNDVRFAFQLQRMLERDARGGTRYVEYLASHFNVDAGDARLQRSEYLGGKRIPINVIQQTQSSASTESDPLGQVGAFSVTGAFGNKIHKGFVEHGYIIGLMAFRQFHTYQQGVRPLWTRKQKTDFYDPVFAHIGEQPIYQSELYASGATNFSTVFGYKPAWEELRSSPNEVHGQMRSVLSLPSSSLGSLWSLADTYATVPILGAQWIQETPYQIDHVLSANSEVVDNFICDIWFDEIAVRNLPTYGIPGLVDHD